MDSSINDSFYHPHCGQFGWKVGVWMEKCLKGVGEMSSREKVLWRRWYLTWDFSSSNSPCCTVSADQSPGPGKCASVHEGHFGCSAHLLDWLPPGPRLLTVRPSQEERHWHWDHCKWTLWEVWASFFYLLFVPSVQVLMLLFNYKLIFLPHILQDLNQIFSWGCIHFHVDLEVIWHTVFLYFLFNHRERKGISLTIRRPEVCWWAAAQRSLKNSACVFATPSLAWFGFSVFICWWQNICFFSPLHMCVCVCVCVCVYIFFGHTTLHVGS